MLTGKAESGVVLELQIRRCVGNTYFLSNELRVQAAAVAKQKEAARELVQQAPAKKLAGALLSAGYQVGRPQLSVGRALHTPCNFYLVMHPGPWIAGKTNLLMLKGGRAGA